MSETLFDATDAYSGDPLRPDMTTPTPDEELLTLSDEALAHHQITVGARLVITEATS